MPQTRCPVCNTEFPRSDPPEEAQRCSICSALINVNASPLDYSKGGGQHKPDEQKRASRLENSRSRFREILPLLPLSRETYKFIDIGCGSGEMLEVGGEFFGESMGFEMNSGLFDYARECGLRVIHGGFDPVRVQGFRETNLLFSICHVLEHIENATGNLEIIHSNMERNDILYVEVPTYDGFSFQKENLSWKLWYSEHLDLWHEDTKRYIVNRLDFKLISAGRRIFAPSQMSKRKIVHDGIANLSRFLISIPSGRYEKIVNSFYGDYLWFLVGRH